jgi:Holliday junction resolvase RusA-like endonuclease
MGARADAYDLGPPPGDRGNYLLPPLCQPTRDLGEMFLAIELPGPPRGKGRPRGRIVPGKNGGPGFVSMYTDAATRNYEAMMRYAGEQAMMGRHLLEGPLRAHIYSVFPIPSSWSQKKQAAAEEGYIRPTGKPDVDNVIKSCLDSLNGIIWRDDAQVVDCSTIKIYGEKPLLRLEIWEITGTIL